MYDRFETFRARLDALAKSLDGKLPQPLLSYLYPQSANGELKAAEERLQATEICQPVMAALGLALAQFLKELGIEPVACTGHSLGEFVAAGVGGILTPEEALRFAAERGRLMAALKLPGSGAMAAVRARPEEGRAVPQAGRGPSPTATTRSRRYLRHDERGRGGDGALQERASARAGCASRTPSTRS